MACVQSKSLAVSNHSRLVIGLDRTLGAGSEHLGIGASVELYPVGTHARRLSHSLLKGIDKDAHPYSLLLEPCHNLSQEVLVLLHWPSLRRGEHAGSVGHESGLVGPHLEHDVHVSLIGETLDVELGVHRRTQLIHIGTGDVPLIGTRMNRDAVGSKFLAVECHLQHIGQIAATCIS